MGMQPSTSCGLFTVSLRHIPVTQSTKLPKKQDIIIIQGGPLVVIDFGVCHNHLKQPLKNRRNPTSPRDLLPVNL